MKFFIKKLPALLVFLLVLTNYAGMAQQNRFIYLQTENKQPFYVKIEKKIFSSSASGYLIIPKLLDGTYTLTLGFPKNEWPEQNVTCTLNKKDAGYIVKNFGDRGWGLFNWQTMEMVMRSDKPAPADVAKTAQPANATIPPPEEPKAAIKSEEKAAPPGESKKEIPVRPRAAITKLLSTIDSEGMQMIFVDNVNGKPDTIRLLIPAEITVPAIQQQKTNDPLQKSNAAEQAEPVVKTAVPAESKPVEKGVQAKEMQKEEKDTAVIKTISPVEVKPTEKTEVVNKQPVVVNEDKKADKLVVPEKKEAPSSKPLLPNSDCKAIAAEDDFLKLRKKMAAENNDDDMVSMAKKTFKSKCFTTLQVKNISVLFLTDEGKYKFFDAAYPFISDTYNFASLESQLTDDYFINRFKAMLRH